jgi:transcriptional regulator with XRE-family HTH domain
VSDMSNLDRQVSLEVATLRRRLGKRQEDMWTALGMSKTSYQELEQCRRHWTLGTLERVASELGVRVADLILVAEEAAVLARITAPAAEVDHAQPATPADLARISGLIDRSSLGTPGARQLQQRTSDEELEHIRSLADRERRSTP